MDIISDILLAIFGAEEAGSAVWSFFTELCEFLGEEGSTLMLEIVPNLRFEFISLVYDSVEVDAEGIICGLSKTINIAGVDSAKLLRFLEIVSSKMANAGIQFVSIEGRSFFTTLMNKLGEFSGPIGLGMASVQVVQLLEQWKAGHSGDRKPIKDPGNAAILPV